MTALPMHPKRCTPQLRVVSRNTWEGVGVGVLLLNHHLHRGHGSTSADPAGCSANGALHATCKDYAPRKRSTQTTPSRNLTLGVMQLVTLRAPETVGRHHPRLRGLLGGLIRGPLGGLRRSTVPPIGAENLGADTLPGRGAPRC